MISNENRGFRKIEHLELTGTDLSIDNIIQPKSSSDIDSPTKILST